MHLVVKIIKEVVEGVLMVTKVNLAKVPQLRCTPIF